VTDSNVTSAALLVVPRVVTGAAAGQAGAGTAAVPNGPSPQASGSIITTTAGSWVYILGAIASNDGQTPLSGTTTTIDTFNVPPGLNPLTLEAGRQSAATGTPGPVTLGWTSGFGESAVWAALEILPGGGGGPGNPAVTWGTPHLVTVPNDFTGWLPASNVGRPGS